MTLCKKCNKNKTKHTYCRKCFLHIIEKRIRKNIRINIGFKKDDKILVMEPICKYIINKFSKIIEIHYISKSKFKIKNWNENVYKNKLLLEFIKKNKIKYTFIPQTIDEKIHPYLNSLFKGEKLKTILNNKKIYPLFNKITSEELLRFCNYRKIKYLQKKSKINEFLNNLENKYPGTKFSISHAID